MNWKENLPPPEVWIVAVVIIGVLLVVLSK